MEEGKHRMGVSLQIAKISHVSDIMCIFFFIVATYLYLIVQTFFSWHRSSVGKSVCAFNTGAIAEDSWWVMVMISLSFIWSSSFSCSCPVLVFHHLTLAHFLFLSGSDGYYACKGNTANISENAWWVLSFKVTPYHLAVSFFVSHHLHPFRFIFSCSLGENACNGNKGNVAKGAW